MLVLPSTFLSVSTLLLASLWLLTLSVQPSSGAMVERSASSGLEQLGARSDLAAMADFNSDKHTDMFVLNSSNATNNANPTWSVEVWLWHKELDAFKRLTGPESTIRSSRLITNVVPGDFNYDGQMDVLVSGPMLDSWGRTVQWLHVYIGTARGFDSRPVEAPHACDQVLVADLNNDLHLDLFGSRFVRRPEDEDGEGAQGSAPSAAEKEASERSYWLSSVSTDGLHTLSWSVVAQSLDQQYAAYPRSAHSLAIPPPQQLRSPHSHATIDLDGDCMADLVVTSTATESDARGAPLVRNYLEIWLNRATLGPVLFSISVLPAGAGQLSFADVDNDGNIDILVPVFRASAAASLNQLHVYYSQSRQLCGSLYDGLRQSKTEAPGDSRGCRSERALCKADPDFFFDFMSFRPDGPREPSPLSANTVVYNFPTGVAGGQFYSSSSSSGALRSWDPLHQSPLTLRLGDINLDGFPDVLMALTPADGSRYGVATLWLNVPCPPPVAGVSTPQPHEEYVQCSSAARARGRRSFSGAGLDSTNNMLARTAAGASAGAAFFDVGEDGQLDIVLTAVQPAAALTAGSAVGGVGGDDGSGSGSGGGGGTSQPAPGAHSTHVFRNRFNEDAYFLTALSSNGVCPGWCPTDEPGARQFPSPKPYGVNMPGGCFRIALTDLTGAQHTSVGGALSQSAYLALQSPAVIFGLGRTNTFIDAFAFGLGLNTSSVVPAAALQVASVSSAAGAATPGAVAAAQSAAATVDHPSLHSRSWPSVIPNAQVLVFPYPPLQPEEWILELFVAPSSQLMWVCVSWAALLTLLALVIAYLHLQEKREDEKEKRKHQLLFTF